MFGINPLSVRPIPDDYDKIRSVFPFGVEGKAGVQSDAILTVTVASATSGGGNRFYIDGVENPVLTLRRGTKYIFDVSDSTNAGHPLRFKDGNGDNYLTNVVITGTQGTAGATVEITVAADAPDSLRYYCTVHGNGMGNTITVADFITILIEGSTSVTGASGVSGVGEARFVHFFDVTGEEATGQVGSVNIALGMTIPETGLQAEGVTGSPDFSLECVIEVTGLEAEVQLGVPIRFETVELTGVGATASVGSIDVDLQLDVPQTGLSGSGATNDVTVSTQQVLLQTGVSATGVVEDIGSIFGGGDIIGEANVLLTGVAATISTADIGDIRLNIIYPVDGVGSTGQVGSVSIAAGATVFPDSILATGQASGAIQIYDLVNPAAFVALDPFDAVDLVEDEEVEVDDVWTELPAVLADEDFTEETPTVSDTFNVLNVSQVDFDGTDPAQGVTVDDVWTETSLEDTVPLDPFSQVDTTSGQSSYANLPEQLANNTYDEVDVNTNTVYSDEEIDQEDFEDGVILDAA